MRGWRAAVVAGVVMLGATGCLTKESRSPDAIRNDTAHVTAGVVRDGSAMVKGVWDGVRQKGPVNINKASEDQLEQLPGIAPETADAIVAGRPYESGADLLHRHIVSKAEYNRIADKIEAR